jgi:nucleoside-diphosphate-sugar epimerase
MMVLIVGCGYVGTYIGIALQPKYPVVVTARSQASLAHLRSIFPFVEHLDSSNLEEFNKRILQHDTLILTLAAKNVALYEATYLETAKNLSALLKNNSTIKYIVYTSSTSVYGEHEGKIVEESTPTLNLSPQGQVLVETENIFLSLVNQQRKVVIFRLGEIYGPGREISKRVQSYQGLSAPGDGSFPTNMTHVEDIARATLFALEHELSGVFNLVDDDHMTRSILYKTICKKLNLPLLSWDPSQKTHHSSKKIVSNTKIKNAGFVFKFLKREII